MTHKHSEMCDTQTNVIGKFIPAPKCALVSLVYMTTNYFFFFIIPKITYESL